VKFPLARGGSGMNTKGAKGIERKRQRLSVGVDQELEKRLKEEQKITAQVLELCKKKKKKTPLSLEAAKQYYLTLGFLSGIKFALKILKQIRKF
jgi:hypothetical protein